MKCKYCSEILVGVITGFLGVMVGAGVMFWARLPDHTVDLLVFSESAFGIGMTVIALIFALVTVNQIKEIDRRFAEISKENEQTVNQRGIDLQLFIGEMVSTEKQSFQAISQREYESLLKAERAADISAANYSTAMTEIGELQERVKKLESKS